jgi:hypothetical protein
MNGFTGIKEIGAFDVYWHHFSYKKVFVDGNMIKIFIFFYFSKIIMNFHLSVPACTLKINKSSPSLSTIYIKLCPLLSLAKNLLLLHCLCYEIQALFFKFSCNLSA